MFRKFSGVLLLCGALLASNVVYAKELPDFTVLVEKQGLAVVNISATLSARKGHGLPNIPNIPEGDPAYEFFKRFMPQNPQPQKEPEPQSLGSGFIVSADGYIMTNAHVVDGTEKITVRLTDKREYRAKVIGADKRTDVALLKIEATNLPTVVLGDISKLKVGEWVVAIGSPFGFDNSVTAGIVSAKGRSLPQETFVPFIQTDVAINPGNSGGPLFNMNGEVVGINSQIYTRTGGSMGLSFAIPIDVAMQVTDQLRSTGKVTRGRIGVAIQEMSRELAESFGLSKPTGALVSNVEKGGAADKAGMEASDVVLKFDGKAIANPQDLQRNVAATKPGNKVEVEVWRKGDTKKLTIQVAEMSEDGKLAKAGKKIAEDISELVNRIGISVAELTKEQLQELQINGGLLIDEIKSSAARAAGLHSGDILLAINNKPLRSAAQLNEVIKSLPAGKNVALLVKRGDSATYVAIKLDEK